MPNAKQPAKEGLAGAGEEEERRADHGIASTSVSCGSGSCNLKFAAAFVNILCCVYIGMLYIGVGSFSVFVLIFSIFTANGCRTTYIISLHVCMHQRGVRASGQHKLFVYNWLVLWKLLPLLPCCCIANVGEFLAVPFYSTDNRHTNDRGRWRVCVCKHVRVCVCVFVYELVWAANENAFNDLIAIC